MKTHRKNGIRALRPHAVGLSIALSIVGCGEGENRLLDRHMADDPNAQAQQRWNAVRGDVKLQVAEQHFKAQRYEEAEAILREVSLMSPDSIGLYKLAARLYLEQGRLMKAREMVDHALTLPGRDAEAEYLAGIVAQRYGEIEAALGHYLAARSLAPDVPEYVLAAAETYVELDEPARALDFLEPRLDDFDGFIPMRMLAAKICRALGLNNAAVEHCQAVISREDRDDMTDIQIARILQWADQYDEVIALLRPIVLRTDSDHGDPALGTTGEINPVHRSAAVTLARAYLAKNRREEAMAVLKPRMAADPADINAWCLFCRAALLVGNLDAARESIDAFNRHNQPTPETRLLQAYVAYRQGDHAAARKAAAAALDLDENLDSARRLLSQIAKVSSRTTSTPKPRAPSLDEPTTAEAGKQAQHQAPSLDEPAISVAVQGPSLHEPTTVEAGKHSQHQAPSLDEPTTAGAGKQAHPRVPLLQAVPETMHTRIDLVGMDPLPGERESAVAGATSSNSAPERNGHSTVNPQSAFRSSQSGMPTFSLLGYANAEPHPPAAKPPPARTIATQPPPPPKSARADSPRVVSRPVAQDPENCPLCREHPCVSNWRTRTAFGSHHAAPPVKTAKLVTEAADE